MRRTKREHMELWAGVECGTTSGREKAYDTFVEHSNVTNWVRTYATTLVRPVPCFTFPPIISTALLLPTSHYKTGDASVGVTQNQIPPSPHRHSYKWHQILCCLPRLF